MLIPPGSFLRNIPQVLNVQETITLDALRVAAEMVECSLVRAEAYATTISENPQLAFPSGWVTALLSDLWGAIFHLNSMRGFISDYDIGEDVTGPFLTKMENVAKLRNAFQHIKNNINNRSNSESSLFPQFGAISWVYWADRKTRAVKFFQCNPNAQIDRKGGKMNIQMPSAQALKSPISFLRLQAFDVTLDFDELRDALITFTQSLNTTFAERARIACQKLSEEKGVPFDKIWIARSGPTIMALPATFSEDGSSFTMPKTPHDGYHMERFN